MDEPDLVVTVQLIGGPDDEPADVSRAVQAMNLRLRDVGTVLSPSAAPAPIDTRAGEVAQFGAVCVALAPVAPSLVAALKIFLTWRGPRGRRVHITGPDGQTFEADNLTEAQQQALVEAWTAAGRSGGS
jgi:hypothetical protein